VLALELRVENGEFTRTPLTELLLLDFNHIICGDIVPQLAGWRRAASSAAAAVEMPVQVRGYASELGSRIARCGAAIDERLLATLAYAEGRLLTLRPFAEYNGRVVRVWLREVLRRLDCPPVVLAPSDDGLRDDYLAALRACGGGEWRPLMEVWASRFEAIPI
jgi:CRISPR-associated endonuclease/helicase Cas3